MPERITHAEFHARLRAQGVSSNYHHAFRCPACKTVQSATCLIAAGAGTYFEAVSPHLAFDCVGRFTGAKRAKQEQPGKGCDWTLGGLFQIHELLVRSSGGDMWPSFAIATPEEARALEAKNRRLARNG